MAERGLLRDRRPPHYPRAISRNDELSLSLTRRVPVRPARFLVGLDRALFPPSEQVEGTAVSVAAYVGRVEEVSKAGEVTVTVWERPNGREGLTALSIRKHFGRTKRPAPGDLRLFVGSRAE
jgi:hypothetical protein